MTAGLVLTSFLLGLRHGVDWDHIAAIADLAGAGGGRRRGLWLSFLYAVGHAAVVFGLGTIAVLAGASIPASLDVWMGRVVGATLIWLGIWVLVELKRNGRNFRLRSRWMLVFDGVFAGLRRVVNRAGRRQIEILHDHAHRHGAIGGSDSGHQAFHDHRHGDELALDETVPAIVPGDRDGSVISRATSNHGTGRRARTFAGAHSHSHRHVLVVPNRADRSGIGTSAATATGVGMLHGVGVESPTQIAVFVGSTSVAGYGAGLTILAAWCLGLVLANSGLAVLAALGLLEARRNFALYATIASVVAVGSIAMGLLYLFDLNLLR